MSSLVPERDELVVGRVPHVVALEDEVLEAEAGAPVLDEVGRPRAVVLDAPDLDVGGVDVDPVVGEAARLGHDERHGEVVAVVQVVGRRDAPRAAAAGVIVCTSSRIGMVEITCDAGTVCSVAALACR